MKRQILAHISLVLAVSLQAVACGSSSSKDDDDDAQPAAEGEDDKNDSEKTGTGTGTGTDDETKSGLADGTNPGAAIRDIDVAMASVGSLVLSGLGLGGVVGTYCDANGTPREGNTNMAASSNLYAAAFGFCQATHNSQSPDTPRGAMYLAGSVACSMGEAKLFEGRKEGETHNETLTIEIKSPCWGDESQVAAMREDMGGDKVENMAVSVTLLGADDVYQYKVGMTFPGDSEAKTMYLRSKDGIRAALFDGWVVKMDASDLGEVKLAYENASVPRDGGSNRTRILIDGEMSAEGAFTKLASIQGFSVVGNDGNVLSQMVTFSGNFTDGILGAQYSPNGGAMDNEGKGFCFLPTKENAECSGVTLVEGSVELATALMNSTTEAATALQAKHDVLLDLSSIDASVTKVFGE